MSARSAHRLEAFAGHRSTSVICLELLNGILNHTLTSQVAVTFSKIVRRPQIALYGYWE